MDVCQTLKLSLRTFFGIFLIVLPAVFFSHMFEKDWRDEMLQRIQDEIKRLGELPCFKEMTIEGSVERIVNEKMALFEADKTGMPDFALETIGGCVLTTRDTKPYADGLESFSVFGIPLTSNSNPKAVIQTSVMPGECWAFQGFQGTVVLQLATDIHVSHISIEHSPRQLSPTGRIPSAPKSFSFYGLERVNDESGHAFGSYEYDDEGPPVQTFPVESPSNLLFRIVEVVFTSNHGNPNYTCVYRIRIHGTIPK